MSNIQEFNEAYWLSFPPEVRALQDMAVDAWVAPQPDDKPAGRTAKCYELAGAGHVLDVEIHVCGRQPFQTMTVRAMQGHGRVPAFMRPGAWIETTTDITKFPPFDPPVVAPETPLHPNPVGPHVAGPVSGAGSVYSSNFGDNHPVGATFRGKSGTFKKLAKAGMFGQFMWWERQG